jgi:hypothetical protein
MARKKKSGKKPIEQYDHKGKKRANNLVAGDSLLVMNSLPEKEGTAPKIVDDRGIESLKIMEVE